MSNLFDPAPPVTVPVEGAGGYPIRRIFCIGRNYEAHAAEMGSQADRAAPFFFTKTPSHVVAPGDWAYPPGTSDVHHEVELVVALGADGRVRAAGVGLDMTRRDLQSDAKQRRRPWDVAKDFEGSAILGQMVEATAEDLGVLDISLAVNGDERQSGSTRDMIHGVPALLAHLCGLYTLGAGDIVMTGTPAGVGPVSVGDRLTGRIGFLPEIEVTVVR
ncbi:fumarylpyruvate hydrolase [Palleronia marisminoris]|uniref:Fumarylpyruvate hydrolase n=1 Tax=Palleronia marisminoris TaxID=315423 RepID=A0A1Y5RH98_9RHOB|nr:fumarylacetoacetate hydrolase family protein [Palleronia marisminoris]SFG20380.1 fumarylpyruvate hydrolase [Palleronia marisminoris]SLN17338.1 Fumarylpyruvate hydrolase [Palleronia marisminoris]